MGGGQPGPGEICAHPSEAHRNYTHRLGLGWSTNVIGGRAFPGQRNPQADWKVVATAGKAPCQPCSLPNPTCYPLLSHPERLLQQHQRPGQQFFRPCTIHTALALAQASALARPRAGSLHSRLHFLLLLLLRQLLTPCFLAAAAAAGACTRCRRLCLGHEPHCECVEVGAQAALSFLPGRGGAEGAGRGRMQRYRFSVRGARQDKAHCLLQTLASEGKAGRLNQLVEVHGRDGSHRQQQ